MGAERGLGFRTGKPELPKFLCLFRGFSINRRRLFPFLALGQYGMMNLYLAEMSAAFPDKKIMLIWDQAGWHKANSLKVPENIILTLPPYSPVLNPVEKLWQWLKKHVCRNRLFAYLDDLMDTLAEILINLTQPLHGALPVLIFVAVDSESGINALTEP